MHRDGQQWGDQFKIFVEKKRQSKPIPNRSELTLEEEMQCRITGGAFINQLDVHGPELLQERDIYADEKGWEKEPFIIFTSDTAGLVAAREILHFSDSPIILYMYEQEYREWLQNNNDNYKWHVYFSSFFTDDHQNIPKDCPQLSVGEEYWVQDESSACGENFALGGQTLWKWDGKETELTNECIHHWRS